MQYSQEQTETEEIIASSPWTPLVLFLLFPQRINWWPVQENGDAVKVYDKLMHHRSQLGSVRAVLKLWEVPKSIRDIFGTNSRILDFKIRFQLNEGKTLNTACKNYVSYIWRAKFQKALNPFSIKI